MYDRERNERNRYFQRIAREYGNEEVRPTRLYEIAAEVIRPYEMGLSQLSPKLYAASSGPDIVRLFDLIAGQGASYYARWGLSLAYVPHRWDPKLRWHRTLKSAQFDVWEDPFEYFDLEGKHWFEWERFFVGRINGEIYLRKQMEEMWTVLAPAVKEWFASTTTLPGVLRAVDAQLEREGASSHHSRSPLLVRAFTLSRIGEIEEARRELGRYLNESRQGAVARENLIAALESVVGT